MPLLNRQSMVRACVVLCLLGSAAGAQVIPAVNRIDVALDHLRGVLYISNGAELARYSLPGQTLLAPVSVGTSLMGMDISPDGATLAVADDAITATENFVHFVDLETMAVTTVPFTRAFAEDGTFSVAWGSDGRLLITSEYGGSSNPPLRRYDPSDGSVTTLTMLWEPAMLVANADRSIIAYEQSNNSAGPFGRYDVMTGVLAAGPGTSAFNYEVGVNRTATQYALPTFGGCLIYDGSFNPVTTVGTGGGPFPIGLVYHPTQDILYVAWTGGTEVRALDTSSFAVLNTYNTATTYNHPGNRAFVEGRMKIANDGSKLFVTGDGGVELIDLGNSTPVGREDSGTVDEDLLLTMLPAGASLLQNDIDFDPGTTLSVVAFDAVSAQGAGVSINGDGTFSYDPTASAALEALNSGDSVVDTFTYTVSDGTASTVVTVSITVNGKDATPLPVTGPAGLLLLILALTGLGVVSRRIATRPV